MTSLHHPLSASLCQWHDNKGYCTSIATRIITLHAITGIKIRYCAKHADQARSSKLGKHIAEVKEIELPQDEPHETETTL